MIVKNCSLNYQYEINENNKDRPVLVFLHGFLGSLKDYDYHISRLKGNYRCISVDLPGHGKSIGFDRENCYGFKRSSESIIDILDKNRIENCILAGYSMGGRLALFTAIEFPDRFKGLVIESASPGIKTKKERKNRYRDDLEIAENMSSSPIDTLLQKWYDQPIFSSLKNHPDFPDLMKSRMNNIPSELAKSLRNMSTGLQQDLWSKWDTINIPSLVIGGDNDIKYIKILSEMDNISKYSRLAIVPECGHNIHFENKNVYIRELLKFLKSIEEV